MTNTSMPQEGLLEVVTTSNRRDESGGNPVGPGEDLLERWWRACETATAEPGEPVDLAQVATHDTGEASLPGEPVVSIRPTWRRRLKPLSAAVLILALAGSSGWLGWDRVQADSLGAARADATRSAVAVATRMADYSYQSLAKDFAAVEQASTAAFAATFKKQSASLERILQQYHASSSGQVADAAAEKWSTKQAEVLVLVTQTVHNSANSKPSPQQNGLLLTMVHQHGRWLLDRVSVK